MIVSSHGFAPWKMEQFLHLYLNANFKHRKFTPLKYWIAVFARIFPVLPYTVSYMHSGPTYQAQHFEPSQLTPASRFFSMNSVSDQLKLHPLPSHSHTRLQIPSDFVAPKMGKKVINMLVFLTGFAYQIMRVNTKLT